MKSKIGLILLFGLCMTARIQAMTLEDAISDAVIHNPEFRAEVKRYNSYQAEVRGAQSAYYPSVDLIGGIGYEEVDNQSINNSGDGLMRRESSIRLTQNLFEGFGTRNEVQRLQHRLDSQSYTVLARANDVALAMAEAFIDLLKEQELLKLAQDNTETHRRILQQIIQRNDAGIGNLVEVDQARARLALAESNFAAVHNNYYDAMARFRRVLGRDPDNILVRPVFHATLPKTLEEATAYALTDHPTLRAATGDIAETQAQYRAADRFNYPRLDLEIERSFDHNISGVRGNNDSLQVMLRMRYNLFRGGRDAAEKNRSVAAYQEASEIRDNARRQVIENLRYAWNAQVFVERQLDFIEQHIKLTYDTLIGYRQQFTLGRRSLLDLLNTENEYYNATRNLISSDAESLKARYRILAAMGHLLPSLDMSFGFIQHQANHSTPLIVGDQVVYPPHPEVVSLKAAAQQRLALAERHNKPFNLLPSNLAEASEAEQNHYPETLSAELIHVLEQPEQRFVLQVFADTDRNNVKAFVARQSQPNHFTIIPTLYNSKPWYLVIYGDYASAKEAKEDLKNLPASLQRLKPWARSYRVMHRLIQAGLEGGQ